MPILAQYNGDNVREDAMTRLLIMIPLLLCTADDAAARNACDKRACDEVKQAIREVEAKMRAGYTRAQGERYEARLRKLRRRRSKVCS